MQNISVADRLTSAIHSEEQKLLACVHCGLCLEACPTYTLNGDENDSPRGRIYLMRAVLEEKLRADSASFKTHIDRCLGCRACEPVCPAGVEYGQLLEASRATLYTPEIERGFTYRLLRLALRHVWLQPTRLRFAFAFARILRNSGVARLLLSSRLAGLISKRFEFGLGLLVSSAPQLSMQTDHVVSARQDSDQMKPALLFTGCVTEGLFARVNEATRRVLRVNGVNAEVAANQVCCGALHAHAGDLEGARLLARQNISAFGAGDAPVITNAGGCGAMLVSYAHLLADDSIFAERAKSFSARVRDVSQQLETSPIVSGAHLEDAVTYDASCHLLNGQHATEAPLKILRAIPDLDLAPLEGAERCCGGAGVYNLLEPEMSAGVLEEKLGHVRATGANVLATGNSGCQMQIGAGSHLAGMELRVCHPIELLDLSYRQAGFYPENSLAMSNRSVNFITLAIFAPLLILVGLAGFLIPPQLSLTSGAPAYNIFHIVFGLLGLAVLWTKKEWLVSSFNAGFGLIDLYQALASYADLPPKQYFLWTGVDDILHIVIGLTLFIIGCYGLIKQQE